MDERVSEKFHTDGSDPLEAEAVREMEAAIEKLLSVTHGESLMLDGYILQAAGIGLDGGTALTFRMKEEQSGVVSAGLHTYLSSNVDDALFGGE